MILGKGPNESEADLPLPKKGPLRDIPLTYPDHSCNVSLGYE